MAATSASAFSIGSTISHGSKASPLSQSKTCGMNISFNSQNNIKCFTGLKSSFLAKESTAALRYSFSQKSQNNPRTSSSALQIMASFKVAILGAAGGIGQPLALLVKMSPLVSDLHLYDIANVKGVAADLSHCNTPSKVRDFTGSDELASCLKDVDVVVIPAGVPRKPGMTRDDLFNINAGIVRTLIEAVADNCPDAFIHIISNPVNSTVPIAAEVLKQKGVYNPKKLFGVTTLDVVRANTFVAEKKNLKLIDVDVPVVGGHAGITILPLLSKTKPSVTFSDQEVNDLTARIQNGGTEVVEAKAGAGSATLSMAYAAARFLESSLRALDGDSDVYECSFVQSEVTELPFFASRVKLGKQGVEAIISSDLEGLTEFEVKGLEALKAELKGSIEKGVAFAQKEKVTA
ncbi:putative malate dehydrogenase [Helianthus annuus]|nr:putative malate dehydrogenase [Helianthus annuus]